MTLSYKEGLALNNGTAQMLATGVLALDRLDALLDTADLAAAMTIDAFAGRLGAFAAEVHALRPHPGQVRVAAQPARAAGGFDAGRHPLPPGAALPAVAAGQLDRYAGDRAAVLRHRLGLGAARPAPRPRASSTSASVPFRGGKKHQPQDSYSLRCVPQVHGAVRDAVEQAKRVLDIELNSVTDNPLVFPDARGRSTSRNR